MTSINNQLNAAAGLMGLSSTSASSSSHQSGGLAAAERLELSIGASSSSSSNRRELGDVLHDSESNENRTSNEEEITIGQEPLVARSSFERLVSWLKEFHVSPSVIRTIPKGVGAGVFANFERTDLDELSGDRGIGMMLRAAQKLVKEQLEKPAVVSIGLTIPTSTLNSTGMRENVAAQESTDGLLAAAAVSKDNVDPYLVSDDYNIPSGMLVVHALYGKQEGG